jgi:hypothetical protein
MTAIEPLVADPVDNPGPPGRARQSGEQSSIGFQPVSSHQPASPFVSRRSGAIVLEPQREPTVVDARYRLEARATLRRRDSEEARLQDDFNTR